MTDVDSVDCGLRDSFSTLAESKSLTNDGDLFPVVFFVRFVFDDFLTEWVCFGFVQVSLRFGTCGFSFRRVFRRLIGFEDNFYVRLTS